MIGAYGVLAGGEFAAGLWFQGGSSAARDVANLSLVRPPLVCDFTRLRGADPL